jgi:Flp pilus assembly protein TadD
MMKQLLACTVAVVVLGLWGCGGPSKVGLENREKAYNRMDAVNAKLVHEQAKSAFETGQLEQARTLLAEAIGRYPDESSWYALMGRILLEQHKLDGSKSMFEKSIELDEEDSASHYYLGVLHERWSDDEAAAGHFAQACEVEPNRPQYVLAHAEALIATGKLEEAEEIVSSHMNRFEHHAGLRHLLAQVSMLQGEHAEAASHCESARLLAPDDLGMAHDLVHMRFAAGDWVGSLDAIDDLKATSGVPPVMQRLEARSLMALGRSIEARTILRSLCDLVQTDPDLWRELGLLGWDIGDWNSVQRAAEHLAGLHAWPYDAGLFQALSDRHNGDLEAAQASLKLLVDEFPERPEAWAVLSGVRMRLGDAAGSSEALDLALKWSQYPADATAVSGVYGTNGP